MKVYRKNASGHWRRSARIASMQTPSTTPTDPTPTAELSPLWKEARGPLVFVLLAAIAWLSTLSHFTPKPASAQAPQSEFSSARAMAHLPEVARAARPTGSPEHTRVREYLLQQFRDLGHVPEVQTATAMRFSLAATVRNILVRIPGTEPESPAVLVTAHYDSRGIAVGTADDGAGVVAILEAVRALGSGPLLRNDLIVLISDAEELGLLGAQAFADEHPWLADVALVLGIEMRGGGGPSMMFETGADNGWIMEAFSNAAPRPWANSISREVYQRMGNSTDFAVFREEGKQGLNFASVAKPNVYHQTYDTVESLSEATVQHIGSQVLAMIRHLGNADLTKVDAPDVIFFTLPLIGLVVYGAVWNWIIGALVGVGWVLALVMLRKQGPAIKSVLMGVVVALIFLGAVFLLSYLLVSLRFDAHPEARALLAGYFHREGWYVLAIASLAMTLAALLFRLFSRWFSASGLILGALAVPVVLAGVLTFAVPFGAMNLQWPTLGACMGALVLIGTTDQGRLASWRWLLIPLAAVPVLLMLVPFIEAFWLALSLRLAAVVGTLVGIAALLLLPSLWIIGDHRWYWLPTVGALATTVFLAIGVSMATPAPDRPAPSTLVYFMDRGTELTYWLTDADRDSTDPGMVWATARVGAFSDASESLGLVGLWGAQYRAAYAPAVDAPLPVVRLVSDGELPSDQVRLSVESSIGAEMISAQPTENGRLVGVNGREFPHDDARFFEHWGVAEGGVLLDFALTDSGEPLSLFVVEHLLRPEELLGEGTFARPPELAPDVRRHSDRVVIRTEVRVDVREGMVCVAARE